MTPSFPVLVAIHNVALAARTSGGSGWEFASCVANSRTYLIRKHYGAGRGGAVGLGVAVTPGVPVGVVLGVVVALAVAVALGLAVAPGGVGRG